MSGNNKRESDGKTETCMNHAEGHKSAETLALIILDKIEYLRLLAGIVVRSGRSGDAEVAIQHHASG